MRLLADSYLHSLDPFVVRFRGDFGIRWYGLAYALGFVLGWLLVRWMAKTRRSSLSVQNVGDLMFAVILGVLVGGRLGYFIFGYSHISGLWTFNSQFPFWEVLAINRGGMASHGGIIGVVLAVTIFARRHGLSALHILDMGALASTIGLCLGRIANFINAELWGKRLPDSMQSYLPGPGRGGLTGIDPPWWSIKYPEEVEHWMANADERLQFLAPLRERLGDLDFPLKIVAAIKRHDAEVISALKPLLTAYYPSQLIQALTDGPILAGVLIIVWMRPRKPGVVGSWFLIAYAIMRITTEVFRQPDAGVGLTFGLQRGQLLSVGMLLTGVICLVIASRRPVPKMPALVQRPAAGEIH